MMNDFLEDNSTLEVEETEADSDHEALPAPKYEIFSYPADTTLKGYLEQWNNGQLFIPGFQREYVWDQTRASKLVESFLLGLPVPPAFLYKPANSKSFWIIDGQQRIRSIIDFQKGIFGETKFRLKGVDQRWVGKTFDDLTEEDQFHLQTSVLRAIVIQQTHPADHSSIYHIFERLNTGGIRLSAMEVRQCVYLSNFLTKIRVLNENANWRAIVGEDRPDKRLKDSELLLRVIALYRDGENYEKPMKKFLNDCAIYFKNAESGTSANAQAEIDDVEAKLLRTFDIVVNELGPKPFHLRGRLNFSALDAVLVTLMRAGTISELPRKYNELISDDGFQDTVSFNTSDESVLKRRFQITGKYLV